MRVSQTYSHLNAKEYLLIRQFKLYREVLRLLNKCSARSSAFIRKSSSAETLKQVGSNFRKSARQFGWSETKVGLRKGRVAMNFYHAPYPSTSTFEEILGSRLIDYANEKIDVAVEIFPTKPGRMIKPIEPSDPQEIRSFQRAKKMIGRFGRHSPPVPLLIIGVS